ncbi:methylmalonyl-CoA mutase [Burkholderia plantarii]|uniref:Methylmalonyl-CoA mutase n=1 Tax=Burkholderia plantarii TaxID=41899 RepID=A0A0B6S226_BURPL|nr:methylmalonyl-CoA mutase [Burkholderia plantarii]AJK48439.1 methylmalonyl-CoA mutase [Burkholderia plantarii]
MSDATVPPRERAVPLRAIYTREDLRGIAHLDALPGQAPFVRGPHPSMYTGRPWTIRQYTGHADAADTNLAFRAAVDAQANGLSVAFDLPTQRGYDSDHREAAADVGLAGVAIDTVDDMLRLFDGIALDRVSVSMTMNGAVLPVLAAFIVAAEARGVPAAQLTGTIQNDILKEYLVRHTWIHAPEPSLRIVAEVAAYLAEHAPRFNALSVSGYHFQEAGADPVFELALTLANARTYVERLTAAGLDADAVCARLSFFFGVGTDFYTEIAKLRAARLLWAEIAAGCGARGDRARALRTHCQTSGWSLSAQEPENNVVRVTVEAMAAVFGGTQSLHTNAWDEALALPSAGAARLARNTQRILQHEMGLCDSVDPWAGSYLMESLTDGIAQRVREELRAIDAQGGMLAVIGSGWARERIRAGARAAQARIDAGRQVVVGVNRFVADDAGGAPDCREIDGRHVRAMQCARLAQARARRDPARVAAALRALTDAARDGGANLLALAIDCMRARATVGECTAALEIVWPRYRLPDERARGVGAASVNAAPCTSGRGDDPAWRAALARVHALAARLGRRPGIVIAKLGQDGHDRGAEVVAAAFADAGFEVLRAPLFTSPEAVAELVAARRLTASVDLLGISTLSGAHGETVPALLDALAARGLAVPVIVGGIVPEAHARLLVARGVADVFGPGVPLDVLVTRVAAAIERTAVPACGDRVA